MTRFEFDPVKNALNSERHGVPLAAAALFEWDHAVIDEDRRKNYREVRYRAIGLINGRMHVLVFTIRPDVFRIISLRKANRREERNYVRTSHAP